MKLNVNLMLLSLCSMLLFSEMQAQGVLGKWEVTNDEGKVNSIIEIYENGDHIVGEVVRIIKEEDRDKKCTECSGDLKDQPIEGLKVIYGFEKEGNEYTGGTLIDPKSGKEYKGKLWVDEANPNQLNVRGYLAFFYKTKTWQRAE